MICKAVIKISFDFKETGINGTSLLQFLYGIGAIIIHDDGFILHTPGYHSDKKADKYTINEYVRYSNGDSATYNLSAFAIGGKYDDVMDERAIYDWAIENECDQFHGVGNWRELLSDLLEAQLNIRTIA